MSCTFGKFWINSVLTPIIQIIKSNQQNKEGEFYRVEMHNYIFGWKDLKTFSSTIFAFSAIFCCFLPAVVLSHSIIPPWIIITPSTNFCKTALTLIYELWDFYYKHQFYSSIGNSHNLIYKTIKGICSNIWY